MCTLRGPNDAIGLYYLYGFEQQQIKVVYYTFKHNLPTLILTRILEIFMIDRNLVLYRYKIPNDILFITT